MSDLLQHGYGARLRQRREELGLSLAEMAARTRIHKSYLHALEEENLAALPAPAYAGGFLRSYARELGLAVEPVRPAPDLAVKTPTATWRPRHGGGGRGKGWLITVAVAVVVAALLAALAWQALGRSRAAKVDGAAPAVDVVSSGAAPAATPPPGGAPQPAPAFPSSAVDLPVLPPGGAIVRMVAVSTGQMLVVLDGQEERHYEVGVEQTLNWKVGASLGCQLSQPGLLRIWVGDEEVGLGELDSFTLTLARP